MNKCKCGKDLPKANKKYCCHKCYSEHNKGKNNHFFGKKHPKEIIEKIKSSEGYKNRRKNTGQKRTESQKENMRIPHEGIRGYNNHRFKKDFPYYGKARQKILDWCRQNKADTWQVLELWFQPCCVCGWNKARCEIHHIIPKSKGGTSSPNNLIVLCPNCHKLAHLNKLEENLDRLKASLEEEK